MSARHISYWISRVIDVTGRKMPKSFPNAGIGQSNSRRGGTAIAGEFDGAVPTPATPSPASLQSMGLADDADV